MARPRPITVTPELIASFESLVIRGASPDDCWGWRNKLSTKGYTFFTCQRQTHRGHRVSYAIAYGDAAPELDVDHLCRNPGCTNPRHLEAVSHQENVIRGDSFAARNFRKTHCDSGHEYTPENTNYDHRGVRECRICNRESTARGAAKYRASEKGKQKQKRDLQRAREQRIAHFERAHPGVPYSVEAARELGQPRGENTGTAKLNAAQVLEIRAKHALGGFSQPSLAREYGVGKSTIEALLNRRTWRHV